MFLVAGVTGNTGGVVAERLLAAGAPVRVLVRSTTAGEAWAARGAEVVVGTLEDEATLGRALEGVRGAYLLLPPLPTSEQVVADNLARLEGFRRVLAKADLRHLVFLSSVGAQLPGGTGPIVTVHHAERLLAAAAPQVTFLRAAYFLENWASALGGLKDGVFPTFIDPDARFDMVATADIGRVAADRLLAGGGDGVEVVELSSGEPTTPREIAGVLGELVGRPLTVVQPPLEQMAPMLVSFGLSQNMAGLYAEMTSALNADPAGLRARGGWVVRGTISPAQVLSRLLGR